MLGHEEPPVQLILVYITVSAERRLYELTPADEFKLITILLFRGYGLVDVYVKRVLPHNVYVLSLFLYILLK